MERFHQSPVGVPETSRSLQRLVNKLVNDFLPEANLHNTQVVNEVRQEIALGTTMQKAIAILNALLAAIVTNSRNGEIHITAERFSDVVILEIQERNNYNGYALAFSIDSLAPEAAAVGGHISIKGSQQKITTISFSFPNNQAA